MTLVPSSKIELTRCPPRVEITDQKKIGTCGKSGTQSANRHVGPYKSHGKTKAVASVLAAHGNHVEWADENYPDCV